MVWVRSLALGLPGASGTVKKKKKKKSKIKKLKKGGGGERLVGKKMAEREPGGGEGGGGTGDREGCLGTESLRIMAVPPQGAVPRGAA